MRSALLRRLSSLLSVTSIVALTAAGAGSLGCKKKSEAAETTGAKVGAAGSSAEKPKLPKGFPEQVDDKALATAAQWARLAPKDVAAVEGLRIPGGGGESKVVLAGLTFCENRYPGVTARKLTLGFLTLAAEDGWEVDRYPKGDLTPSFRLRKGDRIYRVGIIAPDDLPDGSSMTLLYGPGGQGIPPGLPPKIGMAVSSPSSLNAKLYPGKLTKIYGDYGFVVWNTGGGNWASMDEMEPRLDNPVDPTDPPCDVPVGTPVRAPFGIDRKTLRAGKIIQTYHQLVLVAYPDRTRGWAECGEIKK